MHRDDWNAVYINQDRILKALKELENVIFLAGGTGLQRFILPRAYRYSEDLDFFFPTLQKKNQVFMIGKKIEDLISKVPGILIENSYWVREERAYRLWCRFEDNDEIIKVELLNFTCDRLKDTHFIKTLFKTENLYNLLLYKLKALCDRPDTIKDLFDIYFILRDLSYIEIDELIKDLNIKFENAINLRYERQDIIWALKKDLKWDIEIANISYPYDLKEEIDSFKVSLCNVFENEKILDFSYSTRIKRNALKYDIDEKTYLELIDILEDNAFWVDEVRRL